MAQLLADEDANTVPFLSVDFWKRKARMLEGARHGLPLGPGGLQLVIVLPQVLAAQGGLGGAGQHDLQPG